MDVGAAASAAASSGTAVHPSDDAGPVSAPSHRRQVESFEVDEASRIGQELFDLLDSAEKTGAAHVSPPSAPRSTAVLGTGPGSVASDVGSGSVVSGSGGVPSGRSPLLQGSGGAGGLHLMGQAHGQGGLAGMGGFSLGHHAMMHQGPPGPYHHAMPGHGG